MCYEYCGLVHRQHARPLTWSAWFDSRTRHHDFLGKEEWLKTETVTTGMAAVMAAMETVIQLMGKCWELMTSNPLLALCVAAGLLPIGISIFTALRNAARG